MIKILLVVGARPNFMKVAPVLAELRANASEFDAMLVHTGQHYDYEMSGIFFDGLELPRPDVEFSNSRADWTSPLESRSCPRLIRAATSLGSRLRTTPAIGTCRTPPAARAAAACSPCAAASTRPRCRW